MQEEYFKKTELSVLFNNTLKSNPDKKDFLIKLWGEIKALSPVSTNTDSKKSEKCQSCKMKRQCEMLEDVTKFFEKYHNIQDTDEYWHNVVTESADIIRKYDHRFAKAIVHDILDELDKVSRSTF